MRTRSRLDTAAVAEPDAVERPERLCVDDGPGHPGLVRWEGDRLERIGRYPRRRATEPELPAGTEPEPRVVPGCPLEDDKWLRPSAERLEPGVDEPRAEPLLAVLGCDAQRAQYEDLDEPGRCVEPRPRDENVPDELALALGDERKALRPCPGRAQRIDELADDRAAERALDERPDGRSLSLPLLADDHVRRLAHPLDYDTASEPGSSGDRAERAADAPPTRRT